MFEEMQEKLTIQIPTKNRPHFLRKLLTYHSLRQFRGVLFIGDASDAEALKKNREAVAAFQKNLRIVHHPHPPEVSLIGGTNLLLAETKTHYSVLSGDDDFLVPSELGRCVDFLERHEEYSCACGKQAYVYIRKGPASQYHVDRIEAGYSKNHEEALPSQRLVRYCLPARANNTFSVQRTQNMRDGWRKGSEIGLDKTRHHSCLHEVAVNVVSLIQGKQIQFPSLYHVMLRHNEREGDQRSYRSDKSWLKRMCHWDWPEEVQNLVQWWTLELARAEKISEESAAQIAEAVFLQCWIPVMTTWRDALLEWNGINPMMRQRLRKVRWMRRGWAALKKVGQGTKKVSLDPAIHEILLEPPV